MQMKQFRTIGRVLLNGNLEIGSGVYFQRVAEHFDVIDGMIEGAIMPVKIMLNISSQDILVKKRYAVRNSDCHDIIVPKGKGLICLDHGSAYGCGRYQIVEPTGNLVEYDEVVARNVAEWQRCRKKK